jgi:hypothetical protein
VAAGRPRIWKSVEEMQAAIDEYFVLCEGEMLRNEDGTPMLNKWLEPVYINRKPPTVTGLALYLGLNSRQSLLHYQGRKEYCDAVTRAKMRIEEYAETRLFDKEGCNGAKFNLSNNFGWIERQQQEISAPGGEPLQVQFNIPRPGQKKEPEEG